ncbi:MAG: hypothetical protein SGJ11_09505 [Phycisphaerae bacterium]|nr:hypothetical protein [Phycisphaerae bacterium]
MTVTAGNRITALAAGVVAVALAAPALGQLRIVNYNTAGNQGDPNALIAVFTAIAADDKPGFAVAPHIVVFQEVPSSKINELEGLLDVAVAGIDYTRGTYTSSGAEDSAAGAQAVFYRSDMVTELVAGHIDLDTGGGRKTDRWQFQLLGYSSPHAKFYIYGSHLKASPGGANESERLAGAQTIRANSDSLGAGTHIIYCGDFNLYDNGEPAYIEFLSRGNGQAFDPLGTGSWAGSFNAIKHSQSPRDITADGLVGGGLDDRFDFQISTAEFQDGSGLSLIGGTYRSLGNDGQHYNTGINVGNNFYYPGQLARSNALADVLFDASDHIPVIADYQIPAVLSAAMPSSFGKVMQDHPFTVAVTAQNIAAGLVVGIDVLDVQINGTGALTGVVTTSAAFAPALTQVPLAVNTANVGFISGGATVSALSQGAQNSLFLLSTGGQIVRASNASFSAVADTDATVASVSAPAGSASVVIGVPVHNFGFDANQALLDLDTILNLGGGFSLRGGMQNAIGGTPAMLEFSYDASSSASGVYTRDVTINVSDEDIPGAGAAQLQLQLEVMIESSGNAADLDGSGAVDGADLAILLGQWGTAGSADLDGDGLVGVADLAILLGAWNS